MNTKILLTALLTFVCLSAFAGAPIDEGKMIFSTRCAGCHNINKVVTGPALAGVHQRRDSEWIISFIKSSRSMIAAGDKEAVELFQKFNSMPMPDHSDLSAEKINSIIEYIKSEEKRAPAKEGFRPGKKRPAYLPLGLQDYPYLLGFGALVLLLIGALLAAVRVKELGRENG